MRNFMTARQLPFDQTALMLSGHRRALLALSGGIDSMVLLHLLVRLRHERPDFSVRAVYIHHGLSANADAWGAHCRQICQEWQVPFQQVNVTVDAEDVGIEAGARRARYQVFQQQLAADEVFVTAQHLDDQCETFLLALKRGSGPAGLSAMAPIQPFTDTWHIRPLLNVSRSQIERYAREHDLSWVEDESNNDDRYDRNFLRLNVLPIVQQRWPHFSRSVARSAALCAEQEQLLDELLADQLSELINTDGAIAIEPLASMSDVKRQALLRRWFAVRGATMPARHVLQQMWQDIALCRQDAQPQLRLGDKTVRRFKQHLHLLDEMEDVSEQVLPWLDSTELKLPDRLGRLLWLKGVESEGQPIRAPRCDEKMFVKFNAQGDFHIVGRRHSRPIKKLWQELDVPPWRRNRIPLVFFNDTLIAALGVFTTVDGQPTQSDGIGSIVWQPE
jgi:tRNA(Ile)-lysidine synthase